MPKESQKSLCGSIDPLDTETMQRYGDVLRLARDHWEPPHQRLARFDSAVLQLILATISEMENATPTESSFKMSFWGGNSEAGPRAPGRATNGGSITEGEKKKRAALAAQVTNYTQEQGSEKRAGRQDN